MILQEWINIVDFIDSGEKTGHTIIVSDVIDMFAPDVIIDEPQELRDKAINNLKAALSGYDK